ncbi:M14 family zinc carboxypeptidase [Streptomyces sp. NPDC004726]
MPIDIPATIAAIPSIDRFPSVDEMQAELDRLAAGYPELVEIRRIGTSRQGEPIRMLSIGSGERNVLVFGGPHPNEPVGALTVRELGRALCADDALRKDLGCRWHFVPCVDPDGARLNEGWYARPDSRERYGREFYRPAGDEQVEWTFPHLSGPGYFDRMLPETVALTRVIDELKPAVMCSLHNGEYGGVFHYVSTADPDLAARLAAVPGYEDLPLHKAVWEIPASNLIAPGVILAPGIAETTAAMPAGVEAATGASSMDYAAPYGTVSVITEVPYWEDESAADTSPCGRTFGEIVGEIITACEETAQQLTGLIEDAGNDLTLDTPFRRAFQDGLRGLAEMSSGWRALLSDADAAGRSATVSEEFSFRMLPHILRVRYGGTALRLFGAETGAGNVRAGVRRGLAEAERLFTGWLTKADTALPGKRVDIRRVVAVQVGSALAAAEFVRDRDAGPA